MSFDFEKIAADVARLTAEKKASYGDAFGQSGRILEILYPNGVSPEQYGDMLAVARILDKLFRVATRKDAFGESPYRDIVGYGLLGVARDEAEAAEKQEFAKGQATSTAWDQAPFRPGDWVRARSRMGHWVTGPIADVNHPRWAHAEVGEWVVEIPGGEGAWFVDYESVEKVAADPETIERMTVR